ncbi:unnamed protein product [Prorocentrum cordatum]|uniref:Pentatricopeptide repeat-containing protein n=1 Tax=Prorocentrum cordatum TaxID=2364126 RepID=A0ABN9Y2L3_9DINO|nr:unnamed protein product [Polarella glacialis]
MREAKLEPDAISYNAGISACEKGERWQRALALLREMREAKLEPTIIWATLLRSARVRDAASGGMRCPCSARCGSAIWRRMGSLTAWALQRMRGRLRPRQDSQAIIGSAFRVFECLAKRCACGNMLGKLCNYVDGHPHVEVGSVFQYSRKPRVGDHYISRPGWLQRWDQNM